MKLSDLEEVRRTFDSLREAEGTIQKLKDGTANRIVVTVDGVPVDELAEAITPRAIQHFMVLAARYRDILTNLGVEVDDNEP